MLWEQIYHQKLSATDLFILCVTIIGLPCSLVSEEFDFGQYLSIIIYR